MVLDEIAAYLELEGVGTVGTDIFKSTMPDEPSIGTRIMVLIETGGLPPMYALDDTTPDISYERPGIQIIARDQAYISARTFAFEAWDSLKKVVNQSLSGVYYVSITADQSPFSLGPDDNGRHMVAFNVSCEKNFS